MKLYFLILLGFLLFYCTTQKNFKLKLEVERLILKYYNKSIADPLEMSTYRKDRTNVKYLKFKICMKVPTTTQDKINIKAYFIRNNRALFSGIKFDVSFCKAMTVESLGIRKLFQGTNSTDCPLPPGCYLANAINVDLYTVPTGTPIGRYMFAITFIRPFGVIMHSFEIWAEIKEVYM